MLAAGCTGLDALNPICQVGSIGGSIAASGFESVLNGISQWEFYLHGVLGWRYGEDQGKHAGGGVLPDQ